MKRRAANDWVTIWLICHADMVRHYEPEYVSVRKSEHGWFGAPVGNGTFRTYHSHIWREATAEETLELNAKYGI
jgi:hypothetical protein